MLSSLVAELCLEGWAKSPSTGTCIKIHHVKKSWSSARQKCKNEGGDLVRIMERDMNDFLSSKKAFASAFVYIYICMSPTL